MECFRDETRTDGSQRAVLTFSKEEDAQSAVSSFKNHPTPKYIILLVTSFWIGLHGLAHLHFRSFQSPHDSNRGN